MTDPAHVQTMLLSAAAAALTDTCILSVLPALDPFTTRPHPMRSDPTTLLRTVTLAHASRAGIHAASASSP